MVTASGLTGATPEIPIVRMKLKAALLLGWFLMSCSVVLASATNRVASLSLDKPPAPLREFRAAWVASVGNIDLLSKAGFDHPTAEDRVDCAFGFGGSTALECDYFPSAPGCDALYASALEPWSSISPGKMGRAPAPFYDPLSFAVEAAHERGFLELHAWFNPFRAHHTKALSPVSANHVSKTHPA